MEARSSAAAACLCCLLAAAGCPMMNREPAARQEQPDSPPAEDHEVVGADSVDDVRSAADVQPDMENVRRWIAQIERRDDVRSRVEPRPSGPNLTPAAEDTYELDGQQSGAPPADGPPGSSAEQPTAQSLPPPDGDPLESAASPLEEGPPAPEPPVLTDLDVRAGTVPAAPASPGGDIAPSVNAPVRAAYQSVTLTEFLDQWLARPGDTSFRDQLDRRLLQILAGNYDAARQPLEIASQEQQQMAARMIEALIAVREAHGGEPGEEANRVLDQLEQLRSALVPLSDLRVPTLALARAVHGFGHYEVFDPPHFLAGRQSEFVAYCEIENFVSRRTDDGEHESQFSMRTVVLNRAGDVVLEINDEHIVDRCRVRRHDCFIPRLVRLPATLSPGEYVVKITIIDKIGQKVAEKRATFRIVARS